MAQPKGIDKVKKGVTVKDGFWEKNREKVRVADSTRQAEGLASTARVRALRQDNEAKAEDGTTGVDYKSQEALKKKREMEKRRSSMNSADSLSRGNI